MLAVCSTAAFAFVDTEAEEISEEDLARGIRVFFAGKATPWNADATTDAVCPDLRVTLRAVVCNGRAKGTMTVAGTSHEMYARKDDNGVWHGVLTNEAGEKVGRFRGRYLGQKKVFIGGMKLEGRAYKLYLRRLFLATAEPAPLAE
jgi:hypothetical protein